MLELVIASMNRGKIAEVRQIMRDLPVTLLTHDDVGAWPLVEETADTYLGNALLKARAISVATGKAAIADDSGIEVDALRGGPGVRSSRFAGPEATDAENNKKLVEELARIPPEERSARYRCAAVISFPDGREIGALGSCDGRIVLEARGAGGFGYDPFFVPSGETRTMAELSPEEKHSISHRGKAFRGLAGRLGRMIDEGEVG